MNKIRRTEIRDIKEELTKVIERLNCVINKEQDVFDNMPENLQGSMRGMDSEESIDMMNDAIDSINDAIDCLSNI